MNLISSVDALIGTQSLLMNADLVAGNLTDNGTYHAIYKRRFDNSYVVWTSDVKHTAFYNGKYDMNLEQAHKELSRRSAK